MYSEYIAAALQSSGLDPQAEEALRNIFGNCSLPLTHKAEMTLEVPTNESTNINYQTFLSEIVNQINNHTDNYISYAFSPQLYSTVNNITNVIEGGLNIYAPGVNYVQELLVSELHVTNIEMMDYCWEDVEVLTDASLSYSFNSGTCALTLTLNLTTDTLHSLKDCP